MKVQFIVLKTPGFTAENMFFASDLTDHGWHKWLQNVDLDRAYLAKLNDVRLSETDNIWKIDFIITKPGRYEFKLIRQFKKSAHQQEIQWLPKDKNLSIEIPAEVKKDEMIIHLLVPFTTEFLHQDLFLYGSFNNWKVESNLSDEWKLTNVGCGLSLNKKISEYLSDFKLHEFKIASPDCKNWYPNDNVQIKMDTAKLPYRSQNLSHFHGGDEIILQVFDWNTPINHKDQHYGELLNYVDKIRSAGFTAVWMPPPWKDTSQNKVGYFWDDFSKDSAYGRDKELKKVAEKFKQNGIKVIYDLVLNHKNISPNVTGIWKNIPINKQHANLKYKERDNLNKFEQGNSDLDLTSKDIFNAFVDEIINLIQNYSAEGFRFDFASGFDSNLPKRLIESARKKMQESGMHMPELFLVGEYWVEDQDKLKRWSDNSQCTVFDFPLQQRLYSKNFHNEAIKQGLNANPDDPSCREIAVTFVSNHDTDHSEFDKMKESEYRHYQIRKPIDEKLRSNAYAYILLTPGTPCVFWPHWHLWGKYDGLTQQINDLIKIRKTIGIHASSAITFYSLTNNNGILVTVKGIWDEITIGIHNHGKKLDFSKLSHTNSLYLAKEGWGFIGLSKKCRQETKCLMQSLSSFNEMALAPTTASFSISAASGYHGDSSVKEHVNAISSRMTPPFLASIYNFLSSFAASTNQAQNHDPDVTDLSYHK
jgi:hypothetical protein